MKPNPRKLLRQCDGENESLILPAQVLMKSVPMRLAVLNEVRDEYSEA